ncbi:MAG: CRISPR-associated endonuclease Cas2 [Thermoguttaceae bacterium]
MSNRFMRTIVFFDLPITNPAEKREYRRFRKVLIKNGFVMMQKSVYSKLVLNATAQKSLAKTLRKEVPGVGTVQMITITEKQYAGLVFLAGSGTSDVVDSTERVVFL